MRWLAAEDEGVARVRNRGRHQAGRVDELVAVAELEAGSARRVMAGSSPVGAALRFSSALTSVDLPTLGAPITIMHTDLSSRCGNQRGGEAGDFRPPSAARLLEMVERRHAFLLAEVAHPGGARGGIGEIGLVEELQAGPLPLAPQLLDERIGARVRKARVQHLDHHVDLLHRLRGLLARVGHVAGEPLDRHQALSGAAPCRGKAG